MSVKQQNRRALRLFLFFAAMLFLVSLVLYTRYQTTIQMSINQAQTVAAEIHATAVATLSQ